MRGIGIASKAAGLARPQGLGAAPTEGPCGLRGWDAGPGGMLRWKWGCCAGGYLQRHFCAREKQQEEAWGWVQPEAA